MFWLECAVLISDLAIVYYVAREFYESKETNKVLTEMLSKQKRQKKRVSVDQIIKAATMENK